MTVLTNAFSSEFGWTAGPALNIVTKSGTNNLHGEALYLDRPGDWQAKSFSTKNFCPSSVSTCVTPSTLTSISPVDVPDVAEPDLRLHRRRASSKTRLSSSRPATTPGRIARPSSPARCRPSCCRPTATSPTTGTTARPCSTARLDHKLTANQNLMLRINIDRFHDDNPQDAVGGTSAPSVARGYSRRVVDGSGQSHLRSSLPISSMKRASPIWMATRSRAGRRRLFPPPIPAPALCPSPSDSRALSNLFGHQAQFSDTLSWTHGKPPRPLRREHDSPHVRRLRQRARHRPCSARSPSRARPPRPSIS